MSAASARARGGAPAASMRTVSPAEALMIRCLRNWCDGDEGRARAQMLAALGPGEAQRCLSAFEGLCHARCACAGSEEAVFANFVMMAARGTAEDAQPIAALIFDLPVIGEAADCARTIGASLAGTDEAAPSPSLTTH